MEKKITKKENLTAIVNFLSASKDENINPDWIACLNHEIDLLNKKNDNRKKELTDTQKENIEYSNKIVAFLTEKVKTASTSAIAKEFGLSTQRVAPIMKKLLESDTVVATVEKRVTYYSIPKAE